VRQKTVPLDLVTVADEARQDRLIAVIERWFPSAVVIDAEAPSADPRLLANADLAFLVDRSTPRPISACRLTPRTSRCSP
jgi:fructose-1,6-bisphosphatase/inositol monophosphatase family enzyme